MKNKKLITLISIFSLIVLVVILGSTVFTVRSVSYNWLSSRSKLSADEDYSKSINMPIGSSVFFVDKNSIISKMEKQNPYLQVVSIETVFPNKLNFHVAERESLFAIKLNSGDYVVLDKDMKVLEFIDKVTYSGLNKTQKPILVDLSETSFSFNAEDFILGEVFSYESLTEPLLCLAKAFLRVNYDAFSSKGVFSSISIKQNKYQSILLATRYGLNISIIDSENLLAEKLNLGIEVYNIRHDLGETEGLIEVYYNSLNNKINASFSN